MSEIGACFSEPPLRLEGSVHGQSEAHQEKTEVALTPWPPCAARRPRRPVRQRGRTALAGKRRRHYVAQS